MRIFFRWSNFRLREGILLGREVLPEVDGMNYAALAVILVLAAIPLCAGSSRIRPCYRGCHGCGKCMTSRGNNNKAVPERQG